MIGLLACSMSGICNAVPITFDSPISFSGPPIGGAFVTQGFRFVFGADNAKGISTGSFYCSPECPDNGTNYLLSQDSGRFQAVTMTRVDGGLFSLLGFDAAESFTAPADYLSATSINVLGIRGDGSMVNMAVELDGLNDGSGPGQDFQHFVAAPHFFNVQSLSFNGFGGPFFGQEGNFYQDFSLDNIDVIDHAVPEPSPLVALATGLFGFFLLRRRGNVKR